MSGKTVVGCISSEDPLDESAICLVVDHAEEDSYVDYKQTFGYKEDHHWLEITKDVMAFANTRGGYLVFGVSDGKFEIVGLDEDVEVVLLDVNQVQMKLNRSLDPEICRLRAKKTERNGKSIVVWFIPGSLGSTHVFKKDGHFVFPSGKTKTVFNKGTLYVRRSGANHLADARDLDSIFERRQDDYREQLLDRIAKVVEAPVDQHVLLVSAEESDAKTQKFVIDDAPDSIAIRGMSFSVTPSTPVQEVAGWIAMSKGAESVLPPKDVLWKWYRGRAEIKLTEDQCIAVATFSILQDVPCFFWLQTCSAQKIRDMVLDLVTRRPGVRHLGASVSVAMFIGKRFLASILKRLGDRVERLDSKNMSIPAGGPRALFNPDMVDVQRKAKTNKGETDAAFRKRIAKEIDTIIDGKKKKSIEPPVMDRVRAKSFDCFLYARDDRYVGKR
jgi:hypothetical protein